MSNHHKLDDARKISLADHDPADTGKASKNECLAAMTDLGTELSQLQEWLYAARLHSVLIVLQGMDTSGKDGTISHVMESVNPQGCAVASFKVPTDLERAHDFLWRVHRQAPEKGMITIFNRSHYEDVLVTRVHKIIDKQTCQRRYEHIRQFEELLASSGTLILKFFLNISKDEQERRLLDREQDDEKAWKLSPGDWSERQHWDEYIAAYEDAIGATAAKHAPWYIIPANHKWYRNMVIARAVVDAMRPHKGEWSKDLRALGAQQKAALAKMREAERSGEHQKKA
jgi:PPK2 family polyphosphate:nucleotide phosphotransferase